MLGSKSFGSNNKLNEIQVEKLKLTKLEKVSTNYQLVYQIVLHLQGNLRQDMENKKVKLMVQRVTQIYWQGSRDRYRIDWSYGTDGHNDARLTNGDLDDIAERLPTLVNGERIILVESFTTYAPAFNVGLDAELLFSNFVVTSPRYAPQLAKN